MMQLYAWLSMVLLGTALQAWDLSFVRDIVLFEKMALQIFKKGKSTFLVVYFVLEG